MNQASQNIGLYNACCAALARTASLFAPRPTSFRHPMSGPRAFSVWGRMVNRIFEHIGLTALYLYLFFTLSHQRFEQFSIFFSYFLIYNFKNPSFMQWIAKSYDFQLFGIPTVSDWTAWSCKLFQPLNRNLKHSPSPPFLSYSEQDAPSPHASASASRRALARKEGLTGMWHATTMNAVLNSQLELYAARQCRQVPLNWGICRLGVAID